MSKSAPPNFPPNIEISQEDFKNWSWTIEVDNLWTCAPRTADDVAAVCNWAQQQGYQVRARGIMHSWSPITVTAGTAPGASILLVDTTKYLTGLQFIPRSGNQPPQVKAQVGATMDQLLTFLENQPTGQGAAPGYSFPHTPAPGNLTVGGVLAINAHGSAIPSPADSFPVSYGSLSNQILQFTAVVTDPNSSTPNQYTVRTFQRSDPDAKALLTQLGKAFLVDATLQVIDNYNLRCQSFTNIPNTTLFQKPVGPTPPAQSLGQYLNQSGRVEVIWFPFTNYSWLKVWTNSPKQPSGSDAVSSPYNYPFSDNLPDWVTTIIKQITQGAGALTPTLGGFMVTLTDIGLKLCGATDLWGPSKNTLLYVKDCTLRVTANGYAVHMKKESVQQAIYEFTSKFSELLQTYENNKQYPVNSPLEIRVTGLDSPDNVAAQNAGRPVISGLAQGSDDVANGWDVALWLDVLTLPGTPASDQFYTDLETWIYQNFSGTYAKVFPEWSKGWAYTAAQGPWTNSQVLDAIRQAMSTGRAAGDNWNWEVATLQKYDAGKLFSNPMLDTLFVPLSSAAGA